MRNDKYKSGKNSSISKDLTLAVIFIVLFCSMILIVLNYVLSVSAGLRDLEKMSSELNDQILSSIRIHLWNYEIREVEQILESYFQIDEIVYIKVSNNGDDIIFQKKEPDPVNMIIQKDTVYYNDNQIGNLKMALSPYKIYSEQRTIALRLIILMLINLVIISLSIVFILRMLLARPFKDLSTALNDIAGGNYDKRIFPVPQKDLSSIIDNINALAYKVKEREKGLIDYHDYMLNILEAISSIIITVDKDYKIIQLNPKALKDIPFYMEDPVGEDLFLATEFFTGYRDKIKKANIEMKTIEIPRIDYYRDDKQVLYNMILYPQGKKNPDGIVIRLDDWTKLYKDEEKLREVQKLEAIGSLGAGLAHDFNNSLMGITGASSLISYKLQNSINIDKKSLLESLEIMEQSAKSAENIIKQLTSISKRQELDFCPVDLNGAIRHVYKFCSNTFTNNINMSISYYSEKAMVLADPGQLEQALQNICINACHSMTIMRDKDHEKGGDMKISIDKILADEQIIDTHPEAVSKSYFRISIEDTGTGIDKKNIPRVFEPFFSTKDKGYGTGLGLSMVYNVITLHKGFLNIYSEPGKGTIVNVYLPVFQGISDNKGLPVKDAGFKGEGIVLLCDDEKIIRKIGSKMIQSLGYNVLLSRNGKEAIEVFKKNLKLIDIIILDINMPDMSGEKVFEELKKIKKDIRVIVSSGFRKDEKIDKAMNMGACSFLNKPYSINDLAIIFKQIRE